MNLETIVCVEYGGKVTIIKLRNNEEEKEYILRDSVPLKVGYKVEVKKISKIKIRSKEGERSFPRITEMNIYDGDTLIGRYKEKEINLIN